MGAHVLLAGSNRPAKRDAQRVRNVDPDTRIELTLTLKGKDLPAEIPAKTLTREQFAAEYGCSQADADKVAKALEGYGLNVESVSLSSCSMRVSGTAAQVEAAFQPKLAIYHDAQQGDFRGRESTISIPAELNGIILGVFGLDERKVARRKKAAATPAVGLAAAAARKHAPLTPADLEQRYNFPVGAAAGQQIGIAEFEGGYFPDDVKAFCQKYGRPVPQITTVPVGLTPLTLDEILKLPPQQRQEQLGASGEVMMDVQIIAGLCSSAQIFVYFAPFTEQGWVDLLNAVISGNPAAPVTLSVSWGLPEDAPDWSAGARTAIDNRMKAAAMLGITVCVSSGDDGSGDELTDGRAHVDFPGSSPSTLCVGGTMLDPKAANQEVVWWQSPGRRTPQGTGSTGGGVSIFFPRPSWQNVQVKSLNQGSIDGRVVPDVAALAGPPLYDLIFIGKDAPNGGTSASTPLWAALIARISANLPAAKRQRFLTPLLYQNGAGGKPLGQTVCRDITKGQNASHPQPGVGYQAAVGYDAVTGWGVPDGVALQDALQQ